MYIRSVALNEKSCDDNEKRMLKFKSYSRKLLHYINCKCNSNNVYLYCNKKGCNNV